jgi:uncharacterized protein (DUF1778 family)
VAPIERSSRIGLRIAPEEVEMLQALADADGLSASDIVRTLIRRAYSERFGDRKPPKK